jgi:PH domain/Permuted papain-like amidase enzyme, YaeF/YiiX, C92 family
MFDEESINFVFELIKDNTPPENASETIVSETYDKISGWLRRKQIGGIKRWEWRYFQLSDNKLKYYVSEKSINPDGIFNFNQLTTTIASVKSKSFLIEFYGYPNQFFYKARSHQERQNWLAALNYNIMNSLNSDKILSVVSKKPRFWKYERISDYFFQTNASTGDLLLFQAKTVGAKIQRGIAGSSFDHVAMLLCYSSGKIAVLEATASSGVSLVDWSEFRTNKWINLYSKIIYRKLEVERNLSLLTELENFVNNVKGKKFGLSAKKMIIKKKTKAGSEQDFFCSELVASAYKAIGILPPDLNPTSVWPSNFEKEDGLNFVNASLGPMMVIDFDFDFEP